MTVSCGLSCGLAARSRQALEQGPHSRGPPPEQALALLHWFRRLRVRWEIRNDVYEAFLSLACTIICWRRLAKLSLG